MRRRNLARFKTAALFTIAVAWPVTTHLACASLAPESQGPELDATPLSELKFEKTAATASSGMAEYKDDDRIRTAEWIVCKASAAKASVAVMHGDRAGFDKKRFCDGWIAQAFLAKGLDVVTVNRPGYGATPGPADFAGPASLTAVAAGLKGAQQGSKMAPVVGIWGYSSGATVAGFASKKIKGCKWAILGGGIYDVDEVAAKTQDDYIKAELKMIKSKSGGDALADRSLAYDVSDMPKRVALYHGKLDTAAPVEQAKAFRDSLAGDRYDVSLQLVDGVGHDVPWPQHRKFLETMVSDLMK
jgi:pimeloyl-ACP methyl ester carboxylesterase